MHTMACRAPADHLHPAMQPSPATCCRSAVPCNMLQFSRPLHHACQVLCPELEHGAHMSEACDATSKVSAGECRGS